MDRFGELSRPVGERSSRYTSAIVCRRGHVYASDASRAHPAERCAKCGAKLQATCASCDTPVRGRLVVPGVVSAAPWGPGKFCHQCGSPFPWADRQARIYELQNILDEQDDLDEATRLAVAEQLSALQVDDLDEADQVERWSKIKKLAPGFVDSGQAIIETVATAAIKAALGLP